MTTNSIVLSNSAMSSESAACLLSRAFVPGNKVLSDRKGPLVCDFRKIFSLLPALKFLKKKITSLILQLSLSLVIRAGKKPRDL